MTTLGNVTLWLTLLLAAWGFGSGWIAAARRDDALLASARRTPPALVGVIGVLLVSLIAGLVRQDFNLAFVAQQTTRAMPPSYAVAALGRTLPGNLVLIAVALAAGASLALRRGPSAAASARLVRQACAAIGLAAAALVVLQPFRRLGYTPLEGQGLGLLPRHPLALVEVLLIGCGLAALAVALATRSRDDGRVSPAAVLSWVLLSSGTALRLWRQYAVVTAGLVEEGHAWVLLAWLAAGAVVFRGPSRRLGRRLALAGLAAMVVPIAGSAARGSPRDIRLVTGSDTVVLVAGRPVSLSSLGVSRFEMPGGLTSAATVSARLASEDTRLLTTEQRHYYDVFGHPVGQPQLRPAVLHGALADLRLVYAPERDPPAGGPPPDEIILRASVLPLQWVGWIGLLLLAVSGAVTNHRRAGPA